VCNDLKPLGVVAVATPFAACSPTNNSRCSRRRIGLTRCAVECVRSDDSRLSPLRRLRPAPNVDHMARLDDDVWGTMVCGVITREVIDRNCGRQANPGDVNCF
jgi:hypothetical protein